MFKKAIQSAKDYKSRLEANKEIAVTELRGVLITSLNPAQRSRIERALKSIERIKL